VPHPRSYALCPASLEALGIVRQQQDGSNCPFLDGRLGYYRSMQVWEASQPSTLVLDRSDAEDLGLEFLGAVVEDSVLARYLWETTIHPSVDRVWTRARVHGVTGLDPSSLVQVEIAQQDGTVEKHETRLLVAADGAHSAIRRFAGIAQSASFDYEQTALTVTVEVDRPLNGRCFQRFLASGGPLALLPTFSPNHAIVVWSTTAEQVEHWKDHPDLARHLSELLDCGPENFDPWFPSPSSSDWSFPAPLLRNLMYGAERLIETLPVATSLAILDHGRPFVAPPHLLGVASPVLTFPLSLKHADRYVAPRLALVGDAAHTVHPMAGQGLNLGVQDAVALVDAAVSAIQAGMDPTAYLSSYESKRQAEVAATLGGIHALHSLFGFQNGALKYLKALGMTAVQSAKPLRRELVRVACLGVGSRK
jgi:ubiquinone biosynthesis UbiH/UbiF/VisC/COQ6 family hydroxylase